MANSAASSTPFEITVKGDASCIKEFFAGLSDVISQQTRPQVIMAEAAKDLVPALSTFLEHHTYTKDGMVCPVDNGDSTANSDNTNGGVNAGMSGMLDQLKNMFNGGQSKPTEGSAEPEAAPSVELFELFDLRIDVDLNKDQEQTRYTITYNGTTREVSRDDYQQLNEFRELVSLVKSTPESVLTNLTDLVEKHSGNIEGLKKGLLESGFTEQEQTMVNRAIDLISKAGQELKSVTLHMFLAGKLPDVVSKLATKFGSVSSMAVDDTRPAFSEANQAANNAGPASIVNQLPDLISGVMGAFSNFGGANASSSASSSAPTGSNKSSTKRNGSSAKSMLKRGRGR